VELRPGPTRIGRGSYCDLFIDHATVSTIHCEVILEAGGMTVRDLGSTNGTFVNGQKIRFAPIQIGDQLKVGSVAVVIEEAEVLVVIPEFREEAKPPVMKTPAGKNVCLHHENRLAMWQCTRCGIHICPMCLHRLKRRGGKTLYMCPDCSGPCEVLPEFSQHKKASWFGALKEKMKVTRLIRGRKKQPPSE
jgi:pSer/pThr/pTyr-binding forkhead associated (FHA) protein